ncbi:MAG TPA: hypothetical protein VNK25_00325 [Candidatus Nitrosotenuis sp.]|nr:hypothetical protein [Candidatus Nitrosotenuis sp.]
MLDAKILHKGSYKSRVLQIGIDKKQLVTPTYFPSISSVATRLPLEPLVQSIVRSGYPRLLVSAYDLAGLSRENYNRISRMLDRFSKENNFLLTDSGSFESYWFRDKRWNFKKYKTVVNKIKSDFFTSFDNIPDSHADYSDILRLTHQNAKNSSKLMKDNHCITICHGQSPEQIQKLVKKLSTNNSELCRIIAIPERSCGKTLHDKIKTVQKIRNILDNDKTENVLHILGCGNPLSMALFAMAGADIFDSIDWSRWVVDLRSLGFTDFANLSLTDCMCKVCRMKNMDPILRAILHNLLFYQDFVLELQQSIILKDELNFLRKYVDQKTVSKIVNFF